MTDTLCNAFPCTDGSGDGGACCGSSCETILNNDLLTKIAVYWPTGDINEDGEREIGPPQEIPCHWEDSYQEFVDTQGKTFVSTGTVYVASQIKINGWLWLSSAKVCDDAGTALAEADTLGLTANPPQNQMIRVVMMNPDIDNTETLWKAQI